MFLKIVVIALIILWCVIIFLLSNATGDKSTRDSERIISKIYNKITHNRLKTQTLEKLNIILRKCMHAVVFCILEILIFLCLRTFGVHNWKLSIMSIVLASLYACSDEFHKKFVEGRHCDFIEVLIDIVGAFIGVILMNLINIL